LMVPTPSKWVAFLDGMPSIEWFHVPSVACISPNVRAGRNVKGRAAISWLAGAPSFTTSVRARYRIGAAACSISQVTGNRTAGDGGAGAGVNGEAEAGFGVWVGGKVTMRLALDVGTHSPLSCTMVGPATGRVRIANFRVCARGTQLTSCVLSSCRRGSGAPVADVAAGHFRPAQRSDARAASPTTLFLGSYTV
jgi:hypothetical protein